MRVAQKFAGYSLEEADNLRKACGKKIRALIAAEREKFVDGCERTGYGRDIGTKLFDVIEPFADYAFNKSHSYGYGFVAYQTAWLKAHHPVEYLAALLTSVKDDKDKTAVYLAECRNCSIQVLVPDVNVSDSEFAALGRTIPFGLSAVRNVGTGLVGHIVAEREKNGPFNDFYDFCNRVDPMVLNKRTVESLIKGGAFDAVGHPRQGLCMVFEQIVDRTLERRRKEGEGQFDLFGSAEADIGFDDVRVTIPDMEFDKSQKLAFEKEMLGLYVSDHPLMGAEAALRRHVEASISDLRDATEGVMKVVGGVVTNLSRKYTKKGELMATFVLEDLEAAIEAWVFPRTMQEYGSLLQDDAVVCVKGRLDLREDQPKFVCMEVRRPELTIDGGDLEISVPVHALTESKVNELKGVLVRHPGDRAVVLRLGDKRLRLPAEFRVDGRNGLVCELREVLGPGCLVG
jgi:DNA polymerase-3 subunit alpha